jgi:uncharacterized membrane protein YfcA
MSIVMAAGMVALGISAGVIGGLFGIGGGLVIVPALMLGLGFDQKTASGTSLLAQLLPVAGLAVWKYHQEGQVRFGEGLAIACGLILGTLLGAILSTYVKAGDMKKIYGGFLILVGLWFIFGPGKKPASEPLRAPGVEITER